MQIRSKTRHEPRALSIISVRNKMPGLQTRNALESRAQIARLTKFGQPVGRKQPAPAFRPERPRSRLIPEIQRFVQVVRPGPSRAPELYITRPRVEHRGMLSRCQILG